MKILLDECLPKKLKREVKADLVKTVPEVAGQAKKTANFYDLRNKILMCF